MNFTKRTRQLITLLLLVLAIAFFVGENSDQTLPDRESSDQGSEEKPSAFTTAATILHYDSGELADYQMVSTESVYFDTRGKVEIKGPEITFRDETGKQYRLTAKLGAYDELDQNLSLSGEVNVQRLIEQISLKSESNQEHNDASQVNLELQSEQLNVDIAKRFIYTDQAVKIIHNDQTLKAIGMKASLKNGTLELLSQVRGRYEFK